MRAVEIRPGVRIRWVEVPGASPARVYLHGLGASSAPYYAEAVAHPLLAGRRSLMMDLLGFGISDRPTGFAYSLEGHADALAVALAKIGLRRSEIIGHSMGGAVAIVLAARHPEIVRSLVLVDPHVDPATPALGAPGSRGIAAYGEADFLSHGFERVLREDWTELMERFALEPEGISARHGRALQLRPKARDASVRVRAATLDGAPLLAAPRAFYLRRTFTAQILDRAGLLRATR